MQPVRMLTRALAMFAAVLLCAGCLQSMHPLFTEDQLILDPALLGTWVKASNGELMLFARGEDMSDTARAYAMRATKPDGDTQEFAAALGQIGIHIFLNTVPYESKESDYDIHYLPLHNFTRIWVEADTLRIAQIDDDWFEGVNGQEENPVRFEKLDDRLILTASTEEMQSFFERHDTDGEGALEGIEVYYREK